MCQFVDGGGGIGYQRVCACLNLWSVHVCVCVSEFVK